jgi:hypothetical protein
MNDEIKVVMIKDVYYEAEDAYLFGNPEFKVKKNLLSRSE